MKKLSLKTVPLKKPGPLWSMTADDNGVWVGGQGWGDGSLFFSSDGSRFVRYEAQELWNSIGGGILPTLDGEVLVAGWYGIQRSKSSRKGWVTKDNGSESAWVLHRAKDGTIWGAGETDVCSSTNDGKTWKRVGKTAKPIYALVETEVGMVGLGAACSVLGRSVKMRSKLPGVVRGAARSPDGSYVAVGLEGLILQSKDGLAWKRLKSPTREDLFAVAWCGDHFLLGGEDKTLLSLTSDGTLDKQSFTAPAALSGPGSRLDIEAIANFRGQLFFCTMPKPKHEGDTDGGALLTTGPVTAVKRFSAAPFFKAPRGETAGQALDRYQKFLDALAAAEVGAGSREWRARHEPSFSGKVEAKTLAKLEKRLGLTLPPSYRRFVTEHGRFSFGKGSNESRLLAAGDVDRLDTWITREWKLDLADDVGVSPGDLKYLRDSIAFSNGDDGLQLVWFYAFRVDARRADGECPVVPFDQDVIAESARPAKQFRGAPQTFDEHISRLVTTRIEWLAKQYT